MKCPKCGYLGFEAVERCRNCGYDFSLSSSLAEPELSIRDAPPDAAPLDDLALIDAASATPPARRVPAPPEAGRPLAEPRTREMITELPLFGDDDDAPLVTGRRPPRPPLAVRRATPELPRVHTAAPRAPMLDLAPSDSEAAFTAPSTPSTPSERRRSHERVAPTAGEGPAPASLAARLFALIVDLAILTVVDAAVVYFTMQICGLSVSDIAVLPKAPLAAFLLVQNGGYFVAFTAGGQTLGKMMAGIKVVPAESNAPLDIGQAVVRTLIWGALGVPAGLGFLTALLSGDRRGLHDHLAGTKVVRASA